MTLHELIEQNYHKLSDNDLHIWQYISANEAACQDMSIDDLADACHISHTTIIRFARKLGLKGFGELKFILRWQNQQAPPPASSLPRLSRSRRTINRRSSTFARST